ncbi:aminotransferase class I/II-fold pyridoxal phosphate-dependent enzyme [Serratia ureilytica]
MHLVSNSFSNLLAVRRARRQPVGGVRKRRAAGRVLGQLRRPPCAATTRSPPNFGAQLVAKVLNDAQLKTRVAGRSGGMRTRILEMRHALVDTLKSALPQRNFDYLLAQRGVFTPASARRRSIACVKRVRRHLIHSGRMCVAGLNHNNVRQVAEAFAAGCSNACWSERTFIGER